MIPKDRWTQFGHPGNKHRGIVIHNTNNNGMSAKDLEEWIANISMTSQGCHFLVDDKDVIEIMPLSWSVYNVGNGEAFGNTDCVAVEICSNLSTKKYLAGQSKAIDLIKDLMKKYDLTLNDIYYHRDFQPNINCPAQILTMYKNKSEFLALLNDKGGNTQ